MKRYRVTMASQKYGIEEFDYDTKKEAGDAVLRLKAQADKLQDGVDRTFRISEVETENILSLLLEDGTIRQWSQVPNHRIIELMEAIGRILGPPYELKWGLPMGKHKELGRKK
jgi:hypothetical protein